MKKRLLSNVQKENLKADGEILLGLGTIALIGATALSYETIVLLSHGDFHLIRNHKHEAKLGKLEEEDPAENGQEIP